MFISKDLIGTKAKCLNCGNFFTIETTVKYCKEHKSRSMNYPEGHRKAAKRYKQKHLNQIRICRNSQKIKDNELTLSTAVNKGHSWENDELQYIKDNATIMTTKNIAFSLGRTYGAIIAVAFKHKIKLQTYQKLHGKLVTN
jgi:hypothetical protein